MRAKKLVLTATISSLVIVHAAFAFEGRITATLTQGGQPTPLAYTAGTNFLRVEITAAHWLSPVDILDLNSGELTLLFPNNRSFVHLKPAAENAPVMPPGAGLQAPSPAVPDGNIGPANLPGMRPPSAMPQMQPGNGMPVIPMRPSMMTSKIELKATGDKTNLLGVACEKFEIKQRGETMEIWATDKLFPFQPYVQSQPHHFGPGRIEEQWAGIMAGKKLFPLLAVLKFQNGVERYRFEVGSITQENIEDEHGLLFQAPPDYHEIQPLPF